MKAKNISGRLARFLAVLMAMVLIVSCMAIPVALAEESTETSNITFFVFFHEITEAEFSLVDEYLFSKKCDHNVEEFLDPNMSMQDCDETERLVFIIINGGAKSLFISQRIPHELIIWNSLCPVMVNKTNEEMAEIWAKSIVNMMLCGTNVRIYISADDSVNYEVTRLTVEYLTTAFMTGENEMKVTLEEVEEGVYGIQGEDPEKTGTIRFIDLDTIEDPEGSEKPEDYPLLYRVFDGAVDAINSY
jgi:hypothetical protein